jgi:D-amino-acid dehydrogenase
MTHSCGSGRALADIVSGRRPEIEFSFTDGNSNVRPTPHTFEPVAA